MTAALTVMIALCLAVMAGLYLSLRRDAKRRAAKAQAERVAWVRALRDAGFSELQRCTTMRSAGASLAEIARAERDAR